MTKDRLIPNTVPPSSPQGPTRNDLLTDEKYRNGPYPGDDADLPPGEGSPIALHSTGTDIHVRHSGKEAAAEAPLESGIEPQNSKTENVKPQK